MIKKIAETAWHHEGDFDFMMNLLDKIIHKSYTDIIKLHISIDRDEYMATDHPGYQTGKSRQFTTSQLEQLIDKIKSSDKDLMLLLNDTKAIEFGMQFNPTLVEIHSVCLNDIHLLSALKEHNKKDIPVVLGVGGSTLYEIENAFSFLGSNNIILMHGFQNYPTEYENVNFKRIRKIMNLYPEFKHGYADHTAWNEPNNNLITVMGAALGMDYIEKHVTTVPGSERIDWQAAISIEQFNNLAEDIKILDQCNGNGLLKLNEGERNYSVFGPNKKAAFLQNNLKKGDKLKKEDIAFKRTGQISNTSQLEVWDLIEKKALNSLKKGTLITKDKFE
jgi:N,N'-diacetyllegionaminate synthase